MNEENVKIAKIKKSSHIGKIASNILSIVAIVGCVLCIIGSGYIFSSGRAFDEQIEKGIEEGYFTTEDDTIGGVKLVNINVGKPGNIHSDIPAVQEAIDDHPYAIKYGTTLLISAVVCAIAAVMIKLISNVFALIETEDSPFTDKVIKRITIVLGVSSALVLCTCGTALGILGGLVTWVVYTILDYGKTLQIQADETL